MSQSSLPRYRQAHYSILGFGFNQAFLCAVLFLTGLSGLFSPTRLVESVEFFCALGALALTFGSMLLPHTAAWHERCSRFMLRTKGAVLVVALLMCLAGQLGAFSMFHFAASDFALVVFDVIKGVLSGYSLALLLQLWGRAFGEVSINQAVPEVFIGTALGAALSFVFVSLPLGWALCLLYATPLGSVIFLKKLLEDATEEKLQQTSEQPNPQVKPSQEPAHETVQLTARILMGTAAYGLVTGIMEGLGVGTESSISSLGLTLIMLVLYCAAALQLYEGKPLRGNAQSLAPTASALHTSPLAGAYRLALLLLLSGFVAYPLLESMGVAGEAVVMAGFLSVLTVLISLFLIMAHLNNKNTWRSFAKGFASLFAGNIVGIALGFVLQALPLSLNISAALVALAGITALYACLFLFTEADLTALSVEVAKTDTFELVCEYLTREAKLSKRESEILPLALKGRTAERMAQEFYISKNTVDTHLRRIYTKCKVRTRQELIDLSDSVAQQLSQKG